MFTSSIYVTLFLGAYSSKYIPGSNTMGIAKTTVNPKIQTEPTHAGKIPAFSALREVNPVKNHSQFYEIHL